MGKLDVLFEYQQAELKKEQLERDVLQTPSRAQFNKLHSFLREQQNTISSLQADVALRETNAQKLTEQLEAVAHDLELEQSEFEFMLKDDEVTAAELTESRQSYERLQNELNRLKRELNELIKGLDVSLEEYKKTRQQAAKAKKEYDQLRIVCEAEVKDSEANRAAAAKEIAQIEKRVDAALLERYRNVKRNHAAPMAKVENNQCGGCNMSLPTVVVKRLSGSDTVVECDNCGRILYLE